MQILVTGGAGFIGSHIAEALVKQGHSVRVLDDLSTGKTENLAPFRDQIKFIQGSIQDEETCAKACESIEAISHQAAFGSVPRSIAHPQWYSGINVDGFVKICNAARQNGVKRIAYASSSSVYGDSLLSPKKEENTGRPLSPYAASKAADESFAHAFCNVYPLKMVGMRYFNVFGPRQEPNGPYAAVIPKFILALLNNEKPLIHGDGTQSRDFTFVKNVVQANVKALTGPLDDGSHVVNIACGGSKSVNDLFNEIASLLQSSLTPEYGPARAGDVANSLADIGLAKKVLGYEPEVSVEKGLKRFLVYFSPLEHSLFFQI